VLELLALMDAELVLEILAVLVGLGVIEEDSEIEGVKETELVGEGVFISHIQVSVL